MKLTVMYGAIPIHCETISQAVAVAKEIEVTQGARPSSARIHSDEDGALLFNALMGLGKGGRRFAKPLVQNSDWLSAEKFASDLGFKRTTDIEGAISSMKSFLKRRGVEFADVFEEKHGEEGRFFRVRPAIFKVVKKALEVQ
jgi:hypothetical protein